MKKKGLIISTVVMVVVLIASLTTATYAWFTTTASSSIDNINVSVAAGSDVLIGVTTTGEYVTGATFDNFVSGELIAKHGAYTPLNGTEVAAVTAWDGDKGMSGHVNTKLSLDAITKAAATGKIADGVYTLNAKDKQWTSTDKTMIKASGHGDEVTANSYEAAVENWDYLHFTLGAVPNKESVDTITLNITVNPTDAKKIIGMSSAMHIVYRENNGEWVDHNVYDDTTYSYGDAKTKISTASTLGKAVKDESIATASTQLNDGWVNFSITWGTAKTAIGTASENIHQIELYIYYSGVDKDCVDAAVGSVATVYFTLLNTNNAGQA